MITSSQKVFAARIASLTDQATKMIFLKPSVNSVGDPVGPRDCLATLDRLAHALARKTSDGLPISMPLAGIRRFRQLRYRQRQTT